MIKRLIKRKLEKEQAQIEQIAKENSKTLKRILYIFGGKDNIDYNKSELFPASYETIHCSIYLKDYEKIPKISDNALEHLKIRKRGKEFVVLRNCVFNAFLSVEMNKIKKQKLKEQKIKLETELKELDKQIEKEEK